MHPALTEGRAAVITGGASGIGLAAAKRFASLGMKICLADLSQDALDRAAAEMPGATVITVPTDGSKSAPFHNSPRDCSSGALAHAGRSGPDPLAR